MKKIICLLLSFILVLSTASISSAVESKFCIEDVAVNLLNDALKQPNVFNIPNMNNKSIYLCNPINPYRLKGDELLPLYDVALYLVRTDDEIIASITLCYQNGNPISASLDTYIAEVINTNCSIYDAFQLIGENGTLYVKTANNVGTSTFSATTRTTDIDSTASLINNIAGNPEVLSVKSELTTVTINPVITRSDKLLSVPYVPQVADTCWAAAGAAFGRYYTGNTYAHYSAEDLSVIMGIPLNQGAGMSTTQSMLRNIFGLNTTYHSGRLSDSTAINLFQQSKPIIAGFAGNYYNEETDNNEQFAHMVVLCGYDDHATGTNVTFYIRDSNYAFIRSTTSYSNNYLAIYYYDDAVIYWVEGLY